MATTTHEVVTERVDTRSPERKARTARLIAEILERDREVLEALAKA